MSIPKLVCKFLCVRHGFQPNNYYYSLHRSSLSNDIIWKVKRGSGDQHGNSHVDSTTVVGTHAEEAGIVVTRFFSTFNVKVHHYFELYIM